jgi:hypothetical protein
LDLRGDLRLLKADYARCEIVHRFKGYRLKRVWGFNWDLLNQFRDCIPYRCRGLRSEETCQPFGVARKLQNHSVRRTLAFHDRPSG